MYFPTVPKVLHLFDALPPIFLVIVTIEKFYVFLCATSSVNSDVPFVKFFVILHFPYGLLAVIFFSSL